jgi:transcriptional regulator with XRE-family HTH domain
MRIAILIEPLRKGKGMSIRNLSILSGVSHTEIGRIESGEVSPTLDTLFRLSDALRVDIKETFIIEK